VCIQFLGVVQLCCTVPCSKGKKVLEPPKKKIKLISLKLKYTNSKKEFAQIVFKTCIDIEIFISFVSEASPFICRYISYSKSLELPGQHPKEACVSHSV
jgi:hypothetical protein